MNKLLAILGVLLCVGGFSGCGDDREAAPAPHPNYTPELRAFDVVDSNGTDTAMPSHPPLILDPYLNEGLFGIFWDVDSLEDYKVSLRINDRTSIKDSLVVYSQWCGAGRSCDQSGSWVCEYTTDLYLSCGNSSFDLYSVVDKLPEQVYLFIEVCDVNSNYCEYDYYPVTLY